MEDDGKNVRKASSFEVIVSITAGALALAFMILTIIFGDRGASS